MRRPRVLGEHRTRTLRHHHRRTLGHVGPHAAGVIHVMVGQHQELDRLAGILGLGCVDDPARLLLAVGRVEDDEMVFHRNDQVVRRAALDVLHVRRKLDELEAAPIRNDDAVAVEEAREVNTAQHPLVRRFQAGDAGGGTTIVELEG